MSEPHLGIMTLCLTGRANMEERSYFCKLIKQAKKLGMRAFVFTPQDVDSKKHRIHAHLYDPAAGKWSRGWTSFPQLIYDRCRYEPTERFRQFRRFRATYSQLIYLNRPILNKWGMHQFLAKSSRIRPHLPATKQYIDKRDLTEFVRNHRNIYLKPMNGTGGRGILRITRQPNGLFYLQGRDLNRRIVKPKLLSEKQLPGRLSSWNVSGQYLIQQGIQSRLPDGRVHDFRLLIQKNGSGEWEVTGCAGRIGPRKSITSNLHGGGQAISMADLLQRRKHSEEKIEEIRSNVYELGQEIAKTVEGHFGRLCELGIDIAIDPDGHPWVLELNPKPAREVFSRIGEKETYEKAISRPLEFALWLHKQEAAAASPKRRRKRRQLPDVSSSSLKRK